VKTAHRSVQSWLSISSIKAIKEEEKKKAELPLHNLCIVYDKVMHVHVVTYCVRRTNGTP